ncbi:hypothetical protein CRYUN_Cryun40dG0071000 [Craigia yunnanensis]
MPRKMSHVLSILVLLLSLSLLMPPTLTRNTHFEKKVNEEIQRNLIDVKPPDPRYCHAGGGRGVDGHGENRCPPAADSEKKKVYSATKGHN